MHDYPLTEKLKEELKGLGPLRDLQVLLKRKNRDVYLSQRRKDFRDYLRREKKLNVKK